ncbi:hypothetical protein LCGC14_1526480 [marine sediment metagenome]|uniref:Uncharacterized protein n=1 Tax=marine sediment metagenome TaxID=412755 RepID=A0A0F9JI08_9ZZZZ
MSEEEKFRNIIQEIKEIYLDLTEGEPDPDDEISARTILTEKIRELQSLDALQASVNTNLFEVVLTKLENWDTLELWFTESDLPDDFKKIIDIPDGLSEEDISKQPEMTSSEEPQIVSDTGKIDIKEIVDQVSDRFMGEIDNLKQKVENLKHEIEEKDETLRNLSPTRVIKTIKPKKDVLLPPPKIKIPNIGRPAKPPQINGKIRKDDILSQAKFEIKPIEEIQAKIEDELKTLKPSSDVEEIPKETEEKVGETKSVLDLLDELEPAQDISKSELIQGRKKQEQTLSKSKEQMSILDILDEQDTMTPPPKLEVEEKKHESQRKPLIRTEVIEEELSEQTTISPPPKLETNEKKDDKPRRPSIRTEVSVVDDLPANYLSPIPFVDSPSVIIEEIEMESIKSSGTDLFHVFGSIGSEPVKKQSVPTTEFPSLPPTKEKKKIETKENQNEKKISSFVEFGSNEQSTKATEDSISYSSELPTDKDSLYQELIALEGKRYSLEKTFKEVEKSYGDGSIGDSELNTSSEDLKDKLDQITSRINRIRRVIATM